MNKYLVNPKLVNKLAQDLAQISKSHLSNNLRPYLLGICGIPGSGKTTLSELLKDRINEVNGDNFCSRLAMDGFHHTKDYLRQMPDPVEMFKRRGSPITFNVDLFYSKLQEIKGLDAENGEVLYPTFEHEIQDPVQDDLVVSNKNRILIIEGNYLALNLPKWRDVSSLFDNLWFLNIPIETAMERVAIRHVKAKICKDMMESWIRTNYNDRKNAQLILSNKINKIDKEIEME
ncbi:kinase-related protein [Anaeramoeba flamelloides]|uniref:Kinase-related protein n=1 Tax=Anaeramoeba flamelloides TaxID=1746091 RepID=A0AAV8A452_9EUKA|nr:kinase-related protein [Anaeramoeba flamelloides]